MIDVDKLEFVNFLPNNMRGVDRWAEFVSVFQDVTKEFTEDNINILLDQFNKDLMDQDDFINLSINLGWDIIYGEGWTSNLEYFKRQCLTIVPRILNKTTRNSYAYNFWPFNLVGDVFPFYESDATGSFSLEPFWDFWDLNEDPDSILTLDSGLDNILFYSKESIESSSFQFDGDALNQQFPIYGTPRIDGFPLSFLDSNNPPTLDDTSRIRFITRNILVTYAFPLIENSNEFLSSETLRAFYGDTQRLKRVTETLYYEPVLDLQYNTDNTSVTTSYENFEQTETANQETILIGSVLDFENVTSILLGSGQVADINIGPYCVDGVVLEIGSGDIIYDEETLTVPFFRKRTRSEDIIPDFTEACFLNEASGVILYSKFPEIKYDSNMNCGIRFNLIEV